MDGRCIYTFVIGGVGGGGIFCGGQTIHFFAAPVVTVKESNFVSYVTVKTLFIELPFVGEGVSENASGKDKSLSKSTRYRNSTTLFTSAWRKG